MLLYGKVENHSDVTSNFYFHNFAVVLLHDDINIAWFLENAFQCDERKFLIDSSYPMHFLFCGGVLTSMNCVEG